MHDRSAVCLKITQLLPEMGKCGIDVDAVFDEKLQAWRVSHAEAGRRVLTFLEVDDVDRCLGRGECLSLELMAHQLLERSCDFR